MNKNIIIGFIGNVDRSVMWVIIFFMLCYVYDIFCRRYLKLCVGNFLCNNVV